MLRLISKNKHHSYPYAGSSLHQVSSSAMPRPCQAYLLLMGLWISEFLLQVVGLMYYLICTKVTCSDFTFFIKTPSNNFQTYKVCIWGHLPSCTWFPKFRKMALRLFVTDFLNSSTYVMLWSRFYHLCQYAPLLAAHQELRELVLSWFLSGKTSRLRLEMNGRCFKKNAVSDVGAVLLPLPDLFKKEDTFGGRVLYSQTEEYFEKYLLHLQIKEAPVLLFLKASLFPLYRSNVLMRI